MKKQPTQQTTSEKKLFAKLEGLIAKVGYMDEHLTAAQKNVARINARLDVLESTTPPKPTAGSTCPTCSKPKPKPENYVLTDADWQRVMREGWLCEFETASGTSRSIGTLEEIRAGDYCHHAHGYFTKCRPLNRPGVLQPYFNQGMPVKAGTKVLVKQRNGLCSIGKALEQDWNNINHGSDIVAFMGLETV